MAAHGVEVELDDVPSADTILLHCAYDTFRATVAEPSTLSACLRAVQQDQFDQWLQLLRHCIAAGAPNLVARDDDTNDVMYFGEYVMERYFLAPPELLLIALATYDSRDMAEKAFDLHQFSVFDSQQRIVETVRGRFADPDWFANERAKIQACPRFPIHVSPSFESQS